MYLSRAGFRTKCGLSWASLTRTEVPPVAKMTMKRWEKSAADKAKDKKSGYKEGSAKDRAADAKGIKAANKKKK